MAQVSVRINGRHYQVACEDARKICRSSPPISTSGWPTWRDVGQVACAAAQMAGLLIADELADAYDELEELRGLNTQAAAAGPGDRAGRRGRPPCRLAAEARAATAEIAAQAAQKRLSVLEAERGSGEEQIVGATSRRSPAGSPSLAERPSGSGHKPLKYRI